MSSKGITQTPTESLCVQTVDLASLQNELEETFFSDDEETLEAVKYSRDQIHDVARMQAENLLNKDPYNAAAFYVAGLEAESRQDWAEAGGPRISIWSSHASDPRSLLCPSSDPRLPFSALLPRRDGQELRGRRPGDWFPG